MLIEHIKIPNRKLRFFVFLGTVFVIILSLVIYILILNYRLGKIDKKLKIYKLFQLENNKLKKTLNTYVKYKSKYQQNFYGINVGEKFEKYGLYKYDIRDIRFIFPVINVNEAFTNEPASEYGWRYLKGKREFHPAMDIISPFDAEAVASAKGKVVKTGFEKYSGNYILIYHRFDNEEFYTFYCHLDEVVVTKDQEVKQKEVVGIIGATGKSCYGIHLHFEIHKRIKDKYLSFNFVTNSLHRKKVETEKSELYYFLK